MRHFLFSLDPVAYARRERLIFILLAVGAVVWGATDVRIRGGLDPKDPGLHKTDFTCYTEAGAAFFDGRDPYHVTNIRGWGYPYPPLFALFVAPLATCDSQVQVVVWYAISLLMVWGCFWESRKLWRKFVGKSEIGIRKSEANSKSEISNLKSDFLLPTSHFILPNSPFLLWLPWLAALTVALPILNCLQRGQVGIMKAYLLLLGLRLLIEKPSWRRAVCGGVVLSLPIVLKVTPILPVGVLLFGLIVQSLRARLASRERQRPEFAKVGLVEQTLSAGRSQRQGSITLGAFFGVVAGMILFVLLIPGAILGWESNAKHLTTWYREVATRANDLLSPDRTGNTRTIRNQSLSNAVFRAGNWLVHEFAGGPEDSLADDDRRYVRGMLPMDAPAVENVLFLVRIGLIGLVVAGMARMAWRQDSLGMAAMFGLATAATIIVAPLGRGHYFMLLLPAIYLVPLWFWRRGQTRWAWTSSLVPLALCVIHYAALDIAGRAGVLGIGTTIWYAAVTGKMTFSTSGVLPLSDVATPGHSERRQDAARPFDRQAA